MTDIKITVNVSKEIIADTLCSAFDPSSNGCKEWAEISGHRDANMSEFTGAKVHGKYYYYMHAPLYGGALYIKDTQEDDGETLVLDAETIQRGLEIMARDQVSAFADMLSESGDMETADIFVQCCLFGEVTYC